MNYQIEYKNFIDSYVNGETTGIDVGELIARLAQYYADANGAYVIALRFYNIKYAEFESSIDAAGKQISSSKAKVLVSATGENNALEDAKMHLSNIEMMINALKSLQKGILNEYSHMGGV